MVFGWLFGSSARDEKLKKQFTFEVPDAPAVAGEGKPRRSHVLKDSPSGLIATQDPEVETLWDNFCRGCRLAGDESYMGKRTVVDGQVGPYVWTSYKETKNRAQNLGYFFAQQSFKEHECIGLYAVNRQEWIIGEYACYTRDLITVPLYDTLGSEAIQHIVNQTELKLVVASLNKIKSLIDLKSSLPSLKIIISMDPVDAELIKKAADVGVTLIAFEDSLAEGAKKPVDLKLPTKDSVATICYTSGTTGLPKGVVLTHKNILSAAESYQYAAKRKAGIQIDKTDIHISYLPLAHVFERALFTILTGVGAKIGFYQGDTLKLLDDVVELRPTFFASVPRLFNRIYDKVWAGVKAKGGIAAVLFNMAFNSKKSHLQTTVHHSIWDAIVFKNVKAKLGGRVRFMISGSAPLSPEVMEFLRISFACEVLEGYGQTETSAGATITEVGDYSIGHVGVPFPCNDVKLVDVPEMNYRSTDQPFPRGEICFRGHNCFREYYKSPDKTEETVDKDGWIHSGDIGMWDAQGRLKIIDRKKNIFKLAQGEYIAPEKIENVYVNNEFIAQAFVYGDSLQASLVGILFPDEEILKKWAAQNGLGGKTFQELCKLEQVKKHILQVISAHGKSHDLKGFENVKAVYLDSELMSIENNLLTPTFKIKRFEVKQKYLKQIEQMYTELGASA